MVHGWPNMVHEGYMDGLIWYMDGLIWRKIHTFLNTFKKTDYTH